MQAVRAPKKNKVVPGALCACGCGNATKRTGNRTARYVVGHWRRKHGFTAEGFDRKQAKVNERMLRVYGVSRADYDALVARQQGRCAVCSTTDPGKGRTQATALWCIDHDHTTGAVRGLLCRGCNAAIGLFKESAELLERAAQYVRDGGVL